MYMIWHHNMSDSIAQKYSRYLMYSSDRHHEKTHVSLSTKCKEMNISKDHCHMNSCQSILPSTTDMQSDTYVDNDSLICSVIVQLNTPKALMSQIVRYQLAQYMMWEVVFFIPIVTDYLRKSLYILQLVCEMNLSRNNMGRQVHNLSTVQNAQHKNNCD